MQYWLYGLVALGISIVTFFGIRQIVDWPLYLTAIIAVSLATFILYGLDKGNAVLFDNQARYRVPKKLLHLLALLGGFPGGWLGMFVFWHKVRQTEFWVVLILSTILYGILLYVFI